MTKKNDNDIKLCHSAMVNLIGIVSTFCEVTESFGNNVFELPAMPNCDCYKEFRDTHRPECVFRDKDYLFLYKPTGLKIFAGMGWDDILSDNNLTVGQFCEIIKNCVDSIENYKNRECTNDKE